MSLIIWRTADVHGANAFENENNDGAFQCRVSNIAAAIW
jgi:hypothetical protein